MLRNHDDVYPQLLLKGYGLLACMAGTAAVRFWAQGLLGMALLLMLVFGRGKKVTHCLFLCLCFVCALVYGQGRTPSPETVPLWLEWCMGGESSHQRPRSVYITGRVAGMSILADGRLRLQLEDVCPVAPDLVVPSRDRQYAGLSKEELDLLRKAVPYSGQVSVTLRQVQEIPLPGQTVSFNARFAKVRGFANPGVFAIDDYWRDKDIWIRGWNVGGKGKTEVLITGRAYFFAGLRHSLWSRFIQALPALQEQKTALEKIRPAAIQLYQGTGQAFLPALVFGDRSGLVSEQLDLLSRSTLTHSISLSGLHLAYVAFIGMAMALVLGRLFPTLLLRFPRGKLCFVFTVPLAILYLWVGDAPLSLVRSALMLFFFGLTLFWHRTKVLLDGLFAAVFFILIVWPWAVFDISLQLSALSVGVIALFYPVVERMAGLAIRPAFSGRADSFAANRIRAALTLLLMSLCIQVILAPLIVRTFGSAGMWFPLNLVWLPVLGAFVMPLCFAGFLAASLGLDTVAQWVLWLAQFPCQWLMDMLGWMDVSGWLAAPAVMRPHWLIIAGLWLALLTLPPVLSSVWRRIRKKRKFDGSEWAGMLACVSGFLVAGGLWGYAQYQYENQDISLSMLDVGQGQSLVISWPGGRALVDGGGFPGSSFDVGRMVVSPSLTAEKPATLDWMINSHPDFDHLGGMIHVYKQFNVTRGFAYNGDVIQEPLRRLFGPIAGNGQNSSALGADIHVWHAGQVIDLKGGLRLEVLWPPEGGGYKDNDASLVLRLVWHDISDRTTSGGKGRGLALLCGDIGQKAIRHLLASTQPNALRAEVLVLPHHGSRTGFSPALYEAVCPEVVMASCGYKNTWGFPNRLIVEEFKARRTPLYSTAEHGWVRVRWPDAEQPGKVETARRL